MSNIFGGNPDDGIDDADIAEIEQNVFDNVVTEIEDGTLPVSTSDAVILVNSQNTADTTTSGITTKYNDGGVKHAALLRYHGDGEFYLIRDVVGEPDGTTDPSTHTLAHLHTGYLHTAQVRARTSTDDLKLGNSSHTGDVLVERPLIINEDIKIPAAAAEALKIGEVGDDYLVFDTSNPSVIVQKPLVMNDDVSMTGDLNAFGNITLPALATVDDRDVSVDGENLDILKNAITVSAGLGNPTATNGQDQGGSHQHLVVDETHRIVFSSVGTNDLASYTYDSNTILANGSTLSGLSGSTDRLAIDPVNQRLFLGSAGFLHLVTYDSAGVMTHVAGATLSTYTYNAVNWDAANNCLWASLGNNGFQRITTNGATFTADTPVDAVNAHDYIVSYGNRLAVETNNGFALFDVSTPTSPTLIGSEVSTSTNSLFLAVQPSSDLLWVAQASQTLSLWDISTENSPALIVEITSIGATINDIWVHSDHAQEGNRYFVYAAQQGDGFVIYEYTASPDAITAIYQDDRSGSVKGVIGAPTDKAFFIGENGGGCVAYRSSQDVELGCVHVNCTDASTSTVTGALRVAGGVGVVGDITIGGDVKIENNVIVDGNLTINGTQTTVNTESITIEDNIIELGVGNILDQFNTGLIIQNETSGWSGLLRKPSTNEFVLYDGETSKPNQATGVSDPSTFLPADLRVKDIKISNTDTNRNYTRWKTAATGHANQDYTVPTAHPTANGQILSSTTGGIQSWIDPPEGAASQLQLSNVTIEPVFQIILYRHSGGANFIAETPNCVVNSIESTPTHFIVGTEYTGGVGGVQRGTVNLCDQNWNWLDVRGLGSTSGLSSGGGVTFLKLYGSLVLAGFDRRTAGHGTFSIDWYLYRIEGDSLVEIGNTNGDGINISGMIYNNGYLYGGKVNDNTGIIFIYKVESTGLTRLPDVVIALNGLSSGSNARDAVALDGNRFMLQRNTNSSNQWYDFYDVNNDPENPTHIASYNMVSFHSGAASGLGTSNTMRYVAATRQLYHTSFNGQSVHRIDLNDVTTMSASNVENLDLGTGFSPQPPNLVVFGDYICVASGQNTLGCKFYRSDFTSSSNVLVDLGSVGTVYAGNIVGNTIYYGNLSNANIRPLTIEDKLSAPIVNASSLISQEILGSVAKVTDIQSDRLFSTDITAKDLNADRVDFGDVKAESINLSTASGRGIVVTNASNELASITTTAGQLMHIDGSGGLAFVPKVNNGRPFIDSGGVYKVDKQEMVSCGIATYNELGSPIYTHTGFPTNNTSNVYNIHVLLTTNITGGYFSPNAKFTLLTTGLQYQGAEAVFEASYHLVARADRVNAHVYFLKNGTGTSLFPSFDNNGGTRGTPTMLSGSSIVTLDFGDSLALSSRLKTSVVGATMEYYQLQIVVKKLHDV